ncbi:hypothetical protein GWK47_033212 [Chionoecetes opilio]|uniref:Uncharacterized protein n=1 Tax=Chionoecetes opilio TaxID=41210 RepID=A0A8J4YY06_CHIOP|nr:hypothetical protein GWK47_033212 [Chionoecetes opilio]
MSGSQEEVLKVSQKLLLTPEGTAEDGDVSSPHRQEATKSVPSVPTTPLPVPLPTTPLPATPTRRSARKTHTDTLETISEDKVVVSEGRARTPSKDTPSKATRTRKLSATEALETIAENAVLTITEDTHTPATPRRSSRKKCVSPLVSAVLATPKSRRRSSSESHNEETTQPKSLRRTRRLSGDLEKLTPQKRASRMKGEQSDTPAKGAVMEGTAEKEGGSVARRTRRQSLSHSEGSVVEGERGRQGSVTSFAESMSMSMSPLTIQLTRLSPCQASPARSTPVTSIKGETNNNNNNNHNHF